MLCECHGHIFLDGFSYGKSAARHKDGPSEPAVRQNLEACADAGITFFRDGGDKHGVSALARRIAGEYGIDYRTPVYIIYKKGGYGRLFGNAFEDMTEYRTLVLTARRLGADFVKIAASGMLDFNGGGGVTDSSLTLSEMCEMVKIARGEGLSVMAHVNGAVNIKNALEAGVSSVEHGFYIDKDGLSMLRDCHAVWVPTCSAVANLIGTGRFRDCLLQDILRGHYASLRAGFAMGVLIASGSDAGAAYVMHGSGTQNEYALLHGLGISPDAGNRKIAELFAVR